MTVLEKYPAQWLKIDFGYLVKTGGWCVCLCVCVGGGMVSDGSLCGLVVYCGILLWAVILSLLLRAHAVVFSGHTWEDMSATCRWLLLSPCALQRFYLTIMLVAVLKVKYASVQNKTPIKQINNYIKLVKPFWQLCAQNNQNLHETWPWCQSFLRHTSCLVCVQEKVLDLHSAIYIYICIPT